MINSYMFIIIMVFIKTKHKKKITYQDQNQWMFHAIPILSGE